MNDMRLIDADALMQVIDQKFQKHYGNSVYQFIHDFFTCVLRQIRKAPTIDAVPVVRCAKCVFRQRTGRCVKTGFYVNDDEFCSNGERDGDTNG